MSSTTDYQRIRDFSDLLRKNKNAPIEEFVKILESGDKTVPFNPDISLSVEAVNLPVCQVVRAYRFDLLELLIEKYHADVNFRLCLMPGDEVVTVTFLDYVFIVCCKDYDMCMKMASLVCKGTAVQPNRPNTVLLCISRESFDCIDVGVLHVLLRGLDQLPTDKDGRTSLHHIALRCNSTTPPDSPAIAALTELAKVRASIDVFDDYGLTALQYACWLGCLAAVRALIAAGADVNKYYGMDSCTALHLAVAADSIDVVHELLHAGAKTDTDVNCDWVENKRLEITGDPSDVARAAGNFRLARYVADPLRSSLGVLLDSGAADAAASCASAIMYEPSPGEIVDGTCEICMEETKLIPLGHCHHAFCKSCLAHWFRSSSNGVTRPQCPHSGCNLPVSVYDIKAVLGDAEADRVDQLMLQRCLAEMPDFRWCPRCSYGGFFVDQEGAIKQCKDAVCGSCGYMFCTQCHQEAHPGITCASKCLQKIGVARSERWMSENTKPCPACHVPIVKNGGCSHMKCSRCHYEFCWFCLGKYQGVYTFEQRCPCPKKNPA